MSKRDNQDFQYLVAQAMENPGLANMRPVVEKELLHYDILFALDRHQLLDDIVFQGGTSLRLCYNGNRFSEDLDFAGGADFSSRQLKDMKACIEDHLGQRYGLEVTVKEPASLRAETARNGINVDKWQIRIVTSPGQPDLPKQRIKLEVASIPAHTREARPLSRNYAFLPDGYNDVLIMVETKAEIMADKLVSLPVGSDPEKRVRHRDIWDLAWLHRQGTRMDVDLVRRKIDDYLVSDYDDKVVRMIEWLPDIISGRAFLDEMKRFVPKDVYDRTLGQDKFSTFLLATIREQLIDAKNLLQGIETGAPPFKM